MTGSVLLVDDEPGVRDSLGEFFLGEGYQVAIAASEEEAYEVYQARRPAVVVSDLNLAPGSGIKLFQRLKHPSDGQAAPFCILMTGFGTMDNAVEALRVGADEYLTKPLKLSQLRQAVDAGLARSQGRAADGMVSLQRVGLELGPPLQRLRADLQILELGRLGRLNEHQDQKLQAIQGGVLRLLRSLRDFQADGGSGRDPELYLESLDPLVLFRHAQTSYLLDFERKGVSVMQSLPKSLPMVWTDRLHASTLIDLALCTCLNLARPASTIQVDWSLQGSDPSLSFRVMDSDAIGGADGAWPSDAELAPFGKANLKVQALEHGSQLMISFLSTR